MFEVNLVPKVKFAAIRAQRIRDLVTSLCIVASVIAIGICAVLGVSLGIQTGISAGQTARVNEVYKEILATNDVNQILTLHNQLKELDEIAQNQPVFSRILGIISNLMPTNPSTDERLVEFSELSYDAMRNTIRIDAQSSYDFDAGDALSKTFDLAYYDYGAYFGPDGREIHIAHEAIDTDRCLDGATLCNDAECDIPSLCGSQLQNPRYNEIYGVFVEPGTDPNNCVEQPWQPICTEDPTATDPHLIRIYRDGQDYGGYYFESECLQADGRTSSCKLIDIETVAFTDLSYGRNGDNVLMLRFTITFSLDKDALNLQNRHVQLVGIPRQNVTDSFLQIDSSWFSERPADCADDDQACQDKNQGVGGMNG